jgi:hypothetical protein
LKMSEFAARPLGIDHFRIFTGAKSACQDRHGYVEIRQ